MGFAMMRTLRLGSVGPAVKLLQLLLNSRLTPGNKLRVDGHFGKKTEQALLNLQQTGGVVRDGVAGKDTWKMLRSRRRPVQKPKMQPPPVVRLAPLPPPTPPTPPTPPNSGNAAAALAVSPNVEKFVAELGTVDDFVNLAKAAEAKNPTDRLAMMRDLRWNFDQYSKGKRYLIVLQKGGPGVIDFKHFFAAMSEAFHTTTPLREDTVIEHALGGSEGGTLLLGVGLEITQCAQEKWLSINNQPKKDPSCFSPEDLGSNALGAAFGEWLKKAFAENRQEPVSALLRKYLAGLSPAPPSLVRQISLPSAGDVRLEAIAAVFYGLWSELSNFLESPAY